MSEKDFDRFERDAYETQTNSLEALINKYDQTITEFKSTLEKLIVTIGNQMDSTQKDSKETAEDS